MWKRLGCIAALATMLLGQATQYPSSSVLSGTIANIPVASTVGRIYLATDGVWDSIFDNGTSWDYFLGGRKMQCINDAAFSWINQGSTTDTAQSCGILLNSPGSTGFQVRGRIKSKIAATFTITLGFLVTLEGNGPGGFEGICLSSGNTPASPVIDFTLGVNGNAAPTLNATKWNTWNTNSFSANYFSSVTWAQHARIIWLRVQETVANRFFFISEDGNNWTDAGSFTNTDFLTTSFYGPCIEDNNVSLPIYQNIVSWAESTP